MLARTMKRARIPHVDDPVAVGRRLRAAREAAGISQRGLSFPGCSPAYISRLEQGDRTPSLQLLRELGRRLGVDEDYLATGASRGADPLVAAELELRLGEREAAEQALEAAARAADAAERADALAALATVELERGDRVAALAHVEEARALLGDRLAERPRTAELVARAHRRAGEPDAAVRVLEAALPVARTRGDSPSGTRLAVQLADALLDEGETARAQALLEDVTAQPRPTGVLAHAHSHWQVSRAHASAGRRREAERSAYRALGALDLADDLRLAAHALRLLARVALAGGDRDEALAHLDAAEPLAEAAGDPVELALVRLGRARVLVEADPAAALAIAERTAAALEGTDGLLEVSPPLAEVLEIAGRPAEALEALQRAYGASSAAAAHRLRR